jgi:uncharacterized protein (DUF885 family)
LGRPFHAPALGTLSGMKSTARALLVLATLPLISPSFSAADPLLNLRPEATPVRFVQSSELLRGLLDEHVEQILRDSPQTASRRGDERYNDQLEDVGPAAVAAQRAAYADRLARLRALPRDDFSETDRLDADLLEYALATELEGAKFFPEHTPVSARSGPHVWLPQMAQSLSFRTPKHYADYLARLRALPRLIDQTIEQLRAGLAAGRVMPRVTMLGAPEQAAALASPEIEKSPGLSPFFTPFAALPPGDPLVPEARRAIAEGVVPAFRRFADFLRDEYLPKCRESFGISQGVDGPAAYDYALRDHTTTTLTADEIHALGLSEVARIRAEMLETIARTDFPRKNELSGDALFAAFVQYLRTDKRFYHDSAEDLLAGYRDISKRIDAEMPKLFGLLPRTPYGVRELPRLAAPTSPTAYYYPGSVKSGTAGFFVANTYRLDQRPKYEMIALTLHEAVPGHHHQIALATELEGQHPFRTFLGFTAFVEGWALYAERLGLEVGVPITQTDRAPGQRVAGGQGMYADPYDDFGRLTYEMWRATRLVVDTGLHAKKWTRQQAIDFMLANTALSPFNIEREVDRYIAWPGQACAYKIGELKILELRARAEVALAGKFDLRAFHDAVLDSGALPLPVLEKKIDRWIESKR